jgi:hypothetical protein
MSDVRKHLTFVVMAKTSKIWYEDKPQTHGHTVYEILGVNNHKNGDAAEFWGYIRQIGSIKILYLRNESSPSDTHMHAHKW